MYSSMMLLEVLCLLDSSNGWTSTVRSGRGLQEVLLVQVLDPMWSPPLILLWRNLTRTTLPSNSQWALTSGYYFYARTARDSLANEHLGILLRSQSAEETEGLTTEYSLLTAASKSTTAGDQHHLKDQEPAATAILDSLPWGMPRLGKF